MQENEYESIAAHELEKGKKKHTVINILMGMNCEAMRARNIVHRLAGRQVKKKRVSINDSYELER